VGGEASTRWRLAGGIPPRQAPFNFDRFDRPTWLAMTVWWYRSTSVERSVRAERSTWLIPTLVCAWLIGLSLGGLATYRHATARGGVATTPATWLPAASRLQAARGAATGVMFVYPECPCSRASLYGLDTVTRDRPLGTRVIVVFEGTGDGALWERAGANPRIERVLDATLTVARGEYKYVAELEVDCQPLPSVTCWVGELNRIPVEPPRTVETAA